jgi:hypothetical protein
MKISTLLFGVASVLALVSMLAAETPSVLPRPDLHFSRQRRPHHPPPTSLTFPSQSSRLWAFSEAVGSPDLIRDKICVKSFTPASRQGQERQ